MPNEETTIVPDDPGAIADLLAEDSEVEIKEPEDEKEEKEILNLDEKEDKEDKEDKEEHETEIDISTPPRKAQIKAKYPKIFEEFPYLEKIIYRDREIAETFGSFDNLKEAAEKASRLDELEGQVLSGSSVEFFSQVKENDPAAFNKVIKNLLPNLLKVDKQAYVGIVTDVLKRAMFEAHGQAKSTNNEDLKTAVETLVGWAFPGGITNDEPEPESKVDPEFERERSEFQQERLNAAVTEVRTKIHNVLKNTVEQYIDPKGDMTAYMKRKAVEDVLDRIDSDLTKNVPFRKDITKLWDEAEKGKYTTERKDKVKSRYIGAARNLLKKHIMEVRKEVLKDSRDSRRNNSENESENRSSNERRTIPTGRSTPRTGGKLEMKKGESALEFLNRD